MGSCKNTIKEIHLIQEGYKGRVDIIYDHPAGEDAKYENGYQVYEIPKSGMLHLKTGVTEGSYKVDEDIKFFYSNKDGTRTQIYSVKDKERFGSDSVLVSIYSKAIGYKGFEDCDIQLHVREYIVDVPKKVSDYKPYDFSCEDYLQVLNFKTQTGRYCPLEMGKFSTYH